MEKYQFIYKKVFTPLCLFSLLFASCNHGPHYPGPLSPAESMKTFHFADSFKAELYASEPLVESPVSMAFDDEGNPYVVEMQDINLMDVTHGMDKIVLLKDRNGDGRADTSIVFASGIKQITTVLPWKGGLIVTAAPNILYLKDTNGDGRADVVDTLFSEFFDNNFEAQITSLRFNVDNWIYANNDGEPGKIGGKIVSHLGGKLDTIDISGGDLRFRLDRNEFEKATGPGQFGQSFDDWGHRFFTKNSQHIQQVVIPWRYLRRNPYLPPNQPAIENISDHDPIMYQISATPYWREVRTERRNKAFKERGLPPTEYARDHFTGASGGTFYGGNELGDHYYGSIFTGDVSGNLVHRDVLVPPLNPLDPFFTAKRGKHEEKQEFIASTDSWFRPASFATGPDGSLYVVDIYRQHIEDPVSIPEDLGAQMNFKAGMHKGRIYRIVPNDTKGYKGVSPDLDKLSSIQLVQLLSNPNRWWRLNAHRLLIERQDKSVIPAVDDLLRSSSDPRTRIQALYVLEGLNALNSGIIKTTLKDPSPGIRENAAILAERFPDCLDQLEKLVDDSSARVAFQATLSLGSFSGKNIINDFMRVLKKYGSVSWFREAVLTSQEGSSEDMLKQLTSENSFITKDSAWRNKFFENISYIIGNRNNKNEITDVLNYRLFQGNDSGALYILKGLIHGMENSIMTDDKKKRVLKAMGVRLDNNEASVLEDLKKLYH